MTKLHGYFVIADISGYTKYLTSNELEHAQGVVGEITNLLIRELSQPFRFIELEGDAVFVFAPAEVVENAERLIDIVEACYAAFRLLKVQMVTNTNCTCAACRGINDLDLKCVAHFGEYLPQEAPTGVKLLGPDIILTHRLLKNKVIEKTGLSAYAFITEPFVENLGDADQAQFKIKHTEEYESLGMVDGRVIDLNEAVARYNEAENCLIKPQDADVVITATFSAPPSFVWQYFIDAGKRLNWQSDTISVENRVGEDGRTGIGTVSYCDHGSYRMDHRIVDWRPFDYITMQTVSKGRSITKPPSCHVTFAFTPIAENKTALSMRLRVANRSFAMRLMVRMLRAMIRKEWREHYVTLENLIQADVMRGEQAISEISA